MSKFLDIVKVGPFDNMDKVTMAILELAPYLDDETTYEVSFGGIMGYFVTFEVVTLEDGERLKNFVPKVHG